MTLLLKLLNEIGVVTLWSAPRDAHFLLAIRFFRMVAFGQVSIVLVQYFRAIGISESATGLFMALTLAGDVVISFLLTLVADGLGRRKILLWGALMMAVSGAIFASFSNYYVLLIASIIGVISPSGGDIGPFRAVEESSLAHILLLEHRADIYAWYGVLGGIGAACGSMSGGWLLQLLTDKYQLNRIESYRVIFWLYCALGIAKFISTLFLSNQVELEPKVLEPSEASPLLQDDAEAGAAETVNPKPRGILSRMLPHMSPESRRIVPVLSLLFALDAFASSLSPVSWISYYVARKFHISDGYLGSIFFITGLVGSFASLGGSSISKRLGPLLTMVITHLPSSAILAFLPLPNDVNITLILLIVRSCTSTMDVAPRQAFLSAVVLKEERTSVMGWVNVVKTGAQVLGPYVTGSLAEQNKQWICFVMAGSLKVVYDLGILGTFLSVKLDRDNS